MTVPFSYIEIDLYEGVPKRTHARLMRETLRREAVHHLNVTLGKHFRNVPETQPGGAYGYKKRGDRYTVTKLRRFGHNRPMEFTGRSKRYVRTNSTVRATQHKSTLFIRFPFPMRDQMRKEMEAVTREEQIDMQNRATAYYAKEATRPKNQRKRRKRI